jgi:hypothetical protein
MFTLVGGIYTSYRIDAYLRWPNRYRCPQMIYPIATVSNYCNRWCQRCPFTDRCELISETVREQSARSINHLPPGFPALSGRFADFLLRLEKVLHLNGYELGEMSYGVGEEFPQATSLGSSQLKVLAKKVSRGIRSLGGTNWMVSLLRDEKFHRPEVQAARTLAWYLPMIAPSYRRSIPRNSLSRHGMRMQPYLLNARLTHLALARIIASITVLLETHPREVVGDLLPTLRDCLVLLAGIRELFPEVYKIRRPGFDDPGEREGILEFFGGHPPIDPFEDGTWSPGGRPPFA